MKVVTKNRRVMIGISALKCFPVWTNMTTVPMIASHSWDPKPSLHSPVLNTFLLFLME
jgi:hypothetical protein